jgi:hypothetical protein
MSDERSGIRKSCESLALGVSPTVELLNQIGTAYPVSATEPLKLKNKVKCGSGTTELRVDLKRQSKPN